MDDDGNMLVLATTAAKPEDDAIGECFGFTFPQCREGLAIGSESEHTVKVELFFVIGEGVGRICKVDRAVTMDSDIVGSVEQLSFVFIDECVDSSIGFHDGETSGDAFTCDDATFCIEREAIAQLCFTADLLNIDGIAECHFVEGVSDQIGEVDDFVLGVPEWTFCEHEAIIDQFGLVLFSDGVFWWW